MSDFDHRAARRTIRVRPGASSEASETAERPHTRVAVIIATAGRPAAGQDPIDAVDAMSPPLEREGVQLEGLVSAPGTEDIEGLHLPSKWRTVLGQRGLTKQRNAALDALPADTDFVFFFDDDAIPRIDYVRTALKVFSAHPGIVALTGNVIADGARDAEEIPPADGSALLRQSEAALPYDTVGLVDSTCRELYGCNFAVRWSTLAQLRFDGLLPLYSWLEDRDYACRALRLGKLARVEGCVVVHRGSPSGGRMSHLRLGYSQVANPVYLCQKGSFGLDLAAYQLLRTGSKNLLLTALSLGGNEMRRLRLRGNILAVRDIVKSGGVADPTRMLEISDGGM